MGWFLPLISIVATCAAAHPRYQNHHCGSVSVGLSAVIPMVDLTDSDAELHLLFTVTNLNSRTVKLLKRDTPLEGRRTSNFAVQNADGKIMQYRGKDVKRTGIPSHNEYITVDAGETITQTITVESDYQLDTDGLYSFTYSKGLIGQCDSRDFSLQFDHPTANVRIVGADSHESRYNTMQQASIIRKISQQSTRRISTIGCTSSQVIQLTKWHSDAVEKINAAKSCTTMGCSTLVQTWFGPSITQVEFSAVTDVFSVMSSRAGNTIYNCPADSTDACNGNTYAYVYPRDASQTIYMCQFTFDYPDYAEKIQTIVHELSHFINIGSTNDQAYGEQNCYNLAQSSPVSARSIADNYGYFAVYTNLCYRFAESGYMAGVPPCRTCSNAHNPSTGAMSCAPTPPPTPAPTSLLSPPPSTNDRLITIIMIIGAALSLLLLVVCCLCGNICYQMTGWGNDQRVTKKTVIKALTRRSSQVAWAPHPPPHAHDADLAQKMQEEEYKRTANGQVQCMWATEPGVFDPQAGSAWSPPYNQPMNPSWITNSPVHQQATSPSPTMPGEPLTVAPSLSSPGLRRPSTSEGVFMPQEYVDGKGERSRCSRTAAGLFVPRQPDEPMSGFLESVDWDLEEMQWDGQPNELTDGLALEKVGGEEGKPDVPIDRLVLEEVDGEVVETKEEITSLEQLETDSTVGAS